MATSNQPMIVCPSCGKRYSWKAELAGRKIKCKCGQVTTVPAGAPEAPIAEDSYDLADEPATITPPKSSKPVMAAAPNSSAAVPAAKRTGGKPAIAPYMTPRKAPQN